MASTSGGTVEQRCRVGILVSHPIQYLAPLFKALAQDQRLDLTVIFRTKAGTAAYNDPGFGMQVEWDVPLTAGYRSVFLSSSARLGGVQPHVVPRVIQMRFDAIIVHGYSSATHLLGIAAARCVGTKILVRGDTRLQERHAGGLRHKHLVKRLIFRHVDGFVAIGTVNADYYRHLGAKPGQMYYAPLCVDNEAFALPAGRKVQARAEWRRNHLVPTEGVAILFAGKLVEQKRPLDLVDAVERLAGRGIHSWLVFAGSGPLEARLKRECENRNLTRVIFLGFVNQSGMPAVYAACDLLVLPSEAEAWGLSVNEAMAAGLPVVVSDEVGAAPDLVESRGTGAVYRCGDIEALVEALSALVTDAALRERVGAEGRRVIDGWSVSASAAALAAAASAVGCGKSAERTDLWPRGHNQP
jgi:glycosyltransferase involved in cell wall biosynthesis